MKRHILCRIFVVTICPLLLHCAEDAGGPWRGPERIPYPLDRSLRINQIQCLGTHNSYHTTGELGGLPFMQYDHRPLDEQLDMGVRQFELDIHHNGGNGIKVYHLPFFDPETTCAYLVECLGLIRDWSDVHPGHHILFVFIEPKEELDPDTFLGHTEEVDAEILSVWPRDRIFSPEDLVGDRPYETLLEAVREEGWPTMGQVRGKAMFILLDSGPFRDAYVEANPTLAGRIMFVRGGSDDPFGGIQTIGDPREDGERIQEAVRAGFLVRTRADADCVEAYLNDDRRQGLALASGAQMISTDFPSPPPYSDYFFAIPEGTPSRCNPLVAPGACSPSDVEAISPATSVSSR